jgi:predicted DCC family thiol-disulfide oxidoreductase YuxK
MEAPRRPILFYDGECGLCDRFVARVLRADRRGVLRFAPLQGETARRLLPPLPPDRRDWSVAFLDEEGVHRRSDAVLRILRRLGGAWAVLSLARFVPRPVRDAVYRHVARRRAASPGERDACHAPSPAEQGRFLP